MSVDERPVLTFANGKRYTVQQDEVVAGREHDCDLVLDEKQVSRQHIKLKWQDEQWVLEDLSSKNGTWVNGEQLKGERPLKDGDEISVAMVIKLTFSFSESTAPLTVEDIQAAEGGRLRLDRDSRRVFVAGKEVQPPLSLPQYRLLELLFDAKGAVCTRTHVIEAVWPDAVSDGVSEQAIDALVRRLRDRVAEIDPEHQYVITVRGHGFRLDQG
jgi:hypothetical protein